MAVAELVVEAGTLEDVEDVWAIDAAAYSKPWPRKLLADDMVRDDRHHLVARLDGAVVGHASLMTVTDEGHVTTVAVHPEHQRCGIARALMVGLGRHGVASGLASLTLEVRASNKAAHGLYREFGFAPVGARPGYYPAEGNRPKEDALIMWVHNIQGPAYSQRLDALAQTRETSEKESNHG